MTIEIEERPCEDCGTPVPTQKDSDAPVWCIEHYFDHEPEPEAA